MSRYTGSVRAVIFDWAGTVVDFGSRAPARAFVELMRRNGVRLTEAEARGPMGLHKRNHIAELLRLPSVIAQWRLRTGSEPGEADVERLYAEFIPLQSSILAEHADIIPGCLQTVELLRAESILIGSTTGYPRPMMGVLEPVAAARGFRPDAVVTADEVPQGRPAPWMALIAAMRLGVYPAEACVKVGDTIADIGEGLNAGMWTVGVTETGNEAGLSQTELEALSAVERAALRRHAEDRLRQAGAHFVIDGVGALMPVIHEIEGLLSRGERP
jgi:phosphonoacetaldehyde hydrolase